MASEPDPVRGQELFKACIRCHEVGEGAKNKVGPHLDGLIGRAAGSLDGFNYSGALKSAGKDGLVWTAETLDQYITKPREFIKGNRMSYLGMAKTEDRADLIGWLETISRAAPSDDVTPDPASTIVGFAESVLALEGDPAFGEYLSGDCVTCHQVSGNADGIPSIIGIPKDYFVRALFEYKNNIRQNEVMKSRVVNLSNEEIAALAAYFETLQPQ